MTHGDAKSRREQLQPILIALNMRPRTGPAEAAAFLQRMASHDDRTLYAKATGKRPRIPQWSPAALYWAFAPLTAEEIDKAHVELKRAEDARVSIVTWKDREYPPALRDSEAPPPVLYVKGRLLPQDKQAVAIVGARAATREYLELAADLAYGLAKRGYTIVSGLARGVDRYAHQGALEAGGRTLAVLGSGVDVVYPAEHGGLAAAIEAQGALLSFFPMGAKPQPHHFPARNWVIAGLSLGVVVVQGAERSGAVITANAAAAMGREVMAVPGPLGHPLSLGTHGLIHDGARLVTSADEVIEALHCQETAPTEQMERFFAVHGQADGRREKVVSDPLPEQLELPTDSPEARLIAGLASGVQSVEELAASSNLGIGQAQAALTRLEIQGRVVSIGAGRYRLNRRRETKRGSLRL